MGGRVGARGGTGVVTDDHGQKMTDPSPKLAYPRVPDSAVGTLGFLKAVRRNGVSIYGPDVFAKPISRRKVGRQHFVLLNRPDYIEHVLLSHVDNYPKGRLNRRILGPALGQGLLTAEGDFWRRQRRIAAPAFQHARLIGLADTMVASSAGLATRWQAPAEGGEALDVAHEMMALTMEIVALALFSHDIGDRIEPLGAAVGTLIGSLGRPHVFDLAGLPEWLPRRRDPAVTAALSYLDSAIAEILAARRARPETPGQGSGNDLLGMLLDTRDADTGEGMSDRQLRDEIVTLFAAGHETTANTLAWIWYLLAMHPEAEARLHGELDAVLGGRDPGYADLEALPYTRMVAEEAMRLYPPAYSISRVAAADDVIDGHAIPKGSFINVSPWVTQRNPTLWPEPGRFDPERFMPAQVKARSRYAYFPFGGGPRICIGNGFALMEARLILATLAQRYRLALVPGQDIEPLGRITLRPSNGLHMTLQRRGGG